MKYKVKIRKKHVGSYSRMFYNFINGELHREELKPAVEYNDGYNGYYINGDYITHKWIIGLYEI